MSITPTARLPRDLHPVAWWLWALGLAGAASATTNPLLLLLLIGVAATVVAARRSDHPWARSFRLYVWLGVAIVVLRVPVPLDAPPPDVDTEEDYAALLASWDARPPR